MLILSNQAYLERLLGKYYPINMGIAVCHLDIAAEHFGRNPSIVFRKKRKTRIHQKAAITLLV